MIISLFFYFFSTPNKSKIMKTVNVEKLERKMLHDTSWYLQLQIQINTFFDFKLKQN